MHASNKKSCSDTCTCHTPAKPLQVGITELLGISEPPLAPVSPHVPSQRLALLLSRGMPGSSVWHGCSEVFKCPGESPGFLSAHWCQCARLCLGAQRCLGAHWCTGAQCCLGAQRCLGSHCCLCCAMFAKNSGGTRTEGNLAHACTYRGESAPKYIG